MILLLVLGLTAKSIRVNAQTALPDSVTKQVQNYHHVTGSKSHVADAAEAKHWDSVTVLIDKGYDVSQPQVDGMTALHWAAYWNHEPTIRRLVDANCKVDAATRYEVRPLTIACRHGNPAIVEALLAAKANANSKLPSGETVVMTASRTGCADVVRMLLKYGAEVNAIEQNEQTALMWAAAAGNSEVVDVLIEADADVGKSLNSGFTAMMFAAREGHLNVVKRLLKSGMDVNAAMHPKKIKKRGPRNGTSALLLAVESGHFELALSLVKVGADPNDQRSGYTPLHAVSWVRKANRGDDPSGDPPPRGSGKLTSMQFVRQLVQAGADVNQRLENGKGDKAVLNPHGATPILMAARTADVPLMKLLLELGADPLLTNSDGCTPLMAAAGVGVRFVGEEAGTQPEVLEAVALLIQLGADVNSVDQNQETAMHGAAYRNYPQVVNLLAKHGSNPETWNHKNKWGWTPIEIAQGHRPGSFKPSPETVSALQEAMKVSKPKQHNQSADLNETS